jgi:hypothetical protein
MTDEVPDEMTPREYGFATPADLGGRGNYRRFCRQVGLHPNPDGWGFLMCEAADGQRWTRVTADVDYLRTLVTIPTSNVDHGSSVRYLLGGAGRRMWRRHPPIERSPRRVEHRDQPLGGQQVRFGECPSGVVGRESAQGRP